MIDYNEQVLPLCPWPAVHFSSTILLNLKINVRRVKWPCTRRCWTAARDDVPLGKGLYSYQTHASLVSPGEGGGSFSPLSDVRSRRQNVGGYKFLKDSPERCSLLLSNCCLFCFVLFSLTPVRSAWPLRTEPEFTDSRKSRYGSEPSNETQWRPKEWCQAGFRVLIG